MNPIIYILFTYICLSVLIVFLSIKLSDYIDLLDKKTNLSGAFLGGVLLAIITSLPELFTSFSSVIFLNESRMVIGNILGSNSFDILILGFCIIAFYKNYKNDKIDFKAHFIVCLGLIAMYLCLIVPLYIKNAQLVIGTINICFILIAIIYGIVLWRMPKNDEVVVIETPAQTTNAESEAVSNKKEDSIKKIVTKFIICSLLLVGVSILITYATSDIAEYFSLETSTAGVLFLAIATSLPEVVSTIALCSKGNFDASFGNILGSCLFNTFILTLTEFIYFKESILVPCDFASIKLVILNFVSVFATITILLIKRSKKEIKGKRVFDYILSAILVLSYAVYYLI